jgi:ribonucleoside-diphosphate reductase alpha chain
MATSILDYIFRELAVSYLDRNDLAHVVPEDLAPDSLGRGNGVENIAQSVQEEAQEVVERIASKGYVRSKFLVIKGAKGYGEVKESVTNVVSSGGKMSASGQSPGSQMLASVEVAETLSIKSSVIDTADMHMDQVREARMKGYEGDPCVECGNFTLVRNGTCLKCLTCGGTSGCS